MSREEQLLEEALELIVQIDDKEESRKAAHAAEALERWRAISPFHEAAAVEATRQWEALSGLGPQLREEFDEPARAPAPWRVGRRNALLSIAGILCAAPLAVQAVRWYWQQPIVHAKYDSRTAHQLKVSLADGAPGSQLTLAPQSQIAVTLYRGRRVVSMLGGEVHFDVEPDAQRPFQVVTRQLLIEVTGTAFTVRDRGGPLSIGVEQGKVRVRHLVAAANGGEEPVVDPNSESVELHMGQELTVRNGKTERVRQVDIASMSAWKDGWLIFDGVRLDEALPIINAYRIRPIVINDSRVNALQLAGRFRTSDSTGLIAALPTILPVKTEFRPDGLVELHLINR
jgi:transmembrane sensor